MTEIISNKKILAWLWVVLCSIAIFITVPIARSIQRFVYGNWGREVFGYFVLAVLAIGFASLLYHLVFKLKIPTLTNYIWLFLVFTFYTYFTLKLWKTPEEAVHFLEYGLLGFFLFKALNNHIKDKSIYITATLFSLFIGTIDEILQWMTPLRYWDFRDVGLNGLSGGLFQLALWKVVRPKIISEKTNIKSIRIFSSILSSCLILFGLCASNTPERVAFYTEKIPLLSFLLKEEPMSESGYKIKDLEIGAFYSRLSLKDLLERDNFRGLEYAQILNESVDKDYEKFLVKYNPITNPFMHELRVHIYRRDTYFEKGKSVSNLRKKKKFYFIAYKENLILIKYYSHSIKKSIYLWNEDILQELEAIVDKSKSYKSPVSANLFNASFEKAMWISIFSFISILVLINLILPFLKILD